MKKIFLLGLLSFFLASLIPYSGFSQTADDIVKKMIEAQGGKKIFESIKDMTKIGTLEMIQQGLSCTLSLYKKEPDKSRSEIDIMGMVETEAFDGKTAWRINSDIGSVEEIPEEQAVNAKRQALPVVALLYPEKYGLSFALKEKEKIEDKEYFVLEQTYSDGFNTTHYIDPETYLTHKTKATRMMGKMGEVEAEQIFSNYKKVNGMMIPHSITLFIDGVEYAQTTFTEVRINTGLEDSLFKLK